MKLVVDILCGISPISVALTSLTSTLAISEELRLNPFYSSSAATYFSLVIDPLEGVPGRSDEFNLLAAPGIYVLFACLANVGFGYALYLTEVKGYTAPRARKWAARQRQAGASSDGFVDASGAAPPAAPRAASEPGVDWCYVCCIPDWFWIAVTRNPPPNARSNRLVPDCGHTWDPNTGG